MTRVWKGHAHLYQKGHAKIIVARHCAECGTIFNEHPTAKYCSIQCRLKHNSAQVGECIEWTGGCNVRGYGMIETRETGNRKMRSVHRVAYEALVRPITDGLHVLHRCDNRKCINPDHLFLGSNKDNIDDKIAKGRQPYGEGNAAAKLTVEAVRKIKNDGRVARIVAAEHGVGLTTIAAIRQGRTWRHV